MIFQESRMYPPKKDKTHAGTLDLEVKLIDNLIWVPDIKTGKEVDLKKYPLGYDNWATQTAVYRRAVGADMHGVIHLPTNPNPKYNFHFFDLSDHYHDDLIYFDALLHTWYTYPYHSKATQKKIADGWVPSVTEVLKFRGFAPAAWTAVNAMRDKAMEMFNDIPEDGVYDFETIILKARQWGGREMSQAAMARGTRIHEIIEKYLVAAEYPDPDKEPPEILAAFEAFVEWFDANVKEVIATEKKIYG